VSAYVLCAFVCARAGGACDGSLAFERLQAAVCVHARVRTCARSYAWVRAFLCADVCTRETERSQMEGYKEVMLGKKERERERDRGGGGCK
jgi:hypothetical protein